MTIATTYAETAEVTAVETRGRTVLLAQLASAGVWLVISGILGLIASIQLHTPSFLSGCFLLSYGHTSALAQTAFIYGWYANAGLALALWVLGRLGGEPLRGMRWAGAGVWFWNFAVTLGMIGIAAGHATGFTFFQLPRYVDLILLFSYASIALPGILAWTGRRRTMTYASQWYAVAALYLFPWLFTLAQIMLLWHPARGTLQPIIGGWFAQSAWSLWLAPLALAGAYYVVPRSTGRTVSSYEFAPIGFWTLIVIGSWTGGRHLIGGPVPAWVSSIAIVSAALVLFHYAISFINLKAALSGGSVAMRFIGIGILLYALSGLADALTSFRDIAVITQFTYVDSAVQQLALYGGGSLMLIGTAYFALPRLTGAETKGASLHFTLSLIGVLLLVVSLAAAGWIQGKDLLNPDIKFAQIATDTRAWLLSATAAYVLLLLGNLVFLANLMKAHVCSLVSSATGATAFIRQPSTTGVSAS